MQTVKWMKSLLLLSLLCMEAFGINEPISLLFYENECYGDILGSWGVHGGTGCSAYPGGAHFVQTGDGCGPGKCLVIEYWDAASCGDVGLGYRTVVGSGCYNINTGFGPVAFSADCLDCA